MEQSPTFFDPTLFLLFGFMILIYFLMIRPENKRRKTHQDMLASLDVGEEIVTAGGILGKVTKINDQYIELSISDSNKIKIQKTSISAVLPKGTLKSI
jgi:preprotein translocase subunit YajC